MSEDPLTKQLRRQWAAKKESERKPDWADKQAEKILPKSISFVKQAAILKRRIATTLRSAKQSGEKVGRRLEMAEIRRLLNEVAKQ